MVDTQALQKKRLRRIGVISLASYSAVLGLILGIIQGILIASSYTIIGGLVGSGASAIGVGVLGAVIAIIIFTAIGFISGALAALIYNLVARIMGGVELDFADSA